jgi:hypothetical protein
MSVAIFLSQNLGLGDWETWGLGDWGTGELGIILLPITPYPLPITSPSLPSSSNSHPDTPSIGADIPGLFLDLCETEIGLLYHCGSTLDTLGHFISEIA